MTNDREASPNEHDSLVAAPPPLPRRRFQFSLASLLWLTTVVACLAALGVMYRRLKLSEATLQDADRKLCDIRDELGCVEINDPTRICWRGIGERNNHWAWRFYLPRGRQYRLVISSGTIAGHSFVPNSRSVRYLPPGEFVFYAYTGRTGNGKWRLRSEVFDRSMFAGGQGMVDDDIPALDHGFEIGPTDCCSGEREIEPDKPLRLLLCKSTDGSTTDDPQAKKPSDGFHIWIEQDK